MSSYAEIEMQIVQWAEARKIIPNQKPATALLKAASEFGELCDAEAKGDGPGQIDGIGDLMVTLIVYCALKDLNLVDCMYAAYDEIKDRKGTMLPNGIFVKEAPKLTLQEAQLEASEVTAVMLFNAQVKQ